MSEILVTGGSKGIGKALVKKFNAISVSRTSGDFIGDVTDKAFRDHLIENCNPKVFINNAGVSGFDHSFSDVMNTNYHAALDLFHGFYNKMETGHIINIGSIASEMDGFGREFDRMVYCLSKKNLRDASRMFTQTSPKPIRVTYINLGRVATDIKKSDITTRVSLKIEDVVDTVEWIINNKSHISEITLDNERI